MIKVGDIIEINLHNLSGKYEGFVTRITKSPKGTKYDEIYIDVLYPKNKENPKVYGFSSYRWQLEKGEK